MKQIIFVFGLKFALGEDFVIIEKPDDISPVF